MKRRKPMAKHAENARPGKRIIVTTRAARRRGFMH
jgi:hypothetical protein